MLIIEPVRLIMIGSVGFLIALIGTGLVARYLAHRHVFDLPNERSSHSTPTPRGGGIAVIVAITIAWGVGLLTSDGTLAHDLPILFAALLLATIGFIDDLRDLAALPRLFAQVCAVGVGIWTICADGGLFYSLLPAPIDLALTGLFWLWFVNLFNFMDGIDGLTGVEMISIGVGLAGLSAIGVVSAVVLPHAVAITAVALGFLVWNWSPAKIFMGDVGSVPVGFLIAWMLIIGANGSGPSVGATVLVLLLPAYYIADASITLGRRLARRENVFKAHRQHFYQQAVIRGVSHHTVCLMVSLANTTLVAVAWFIAPGNTSAALASAVLIVAILLAWMAGKHPWITSNLKTE